MRNRKVAVMQPYTFPYLGYFQLINAVDTFVFYDDVDFIKKGWINRNKILVSGQAKLITIPCLKISQNKKINEIKLADNPKALSKIFKTIQHAYSKAPFFDETLPIVEAMLTSFQHENIGSFAAKSVTEVCKYLDITTEFKFSSKDFTDNIALNRSDRLIDITKKLDAHTYINPIAGGERLYDKNYFAQQGIQLEYFKPHLQEYPQLGKQFVGGLSIIDVMMFNSKEELKILLTNYELG